tara:strand:- start:113 stop:847 length:735 start_codon:yes stop_codon:yes gene_type:complete
MSKSILIIGGTSDIGISVAKKFASQDYNIFLTARNIQSLESVKKELELNQKIEVTLLKLDILDANSYKTFLDNFEKIPEVVICSVGYMGDQLINEKSLHERSLVMKTNYEGPVNFLSEIANHYEKKQSGTIIGISSVAGDRGRAINYIYGSAKSGFTAFLSGLRNRLFKNNVKVITILPGPVETKMTKEMKLPKFLTSKPEFVADAIYRAVINKKDIVYIKPIWRLIMLIIKLIPEKIFKSKNF